jgi:serine/threonine protein kinase
MIEAGQACSATGRIHAHRNVAAEGWKEGDAEEHALCSCIMSSSARTTEEASVTDDLLGSSIGQYRIQEEIGRGGMGVVYRAVHSEIGQLAAVKVLSSRCAHNPRDVRRFINEAKAVSRIDHPGLVKMFDFGQTQTGVPYILMEYLRGELLKARIERFRKERRAMSVSEALRVSRQTAAALCAAHDKGIVHRDLKPSNLMLVPDEEAPCGERAKLLDFGVARFVTDSGERTAPGVVVGTAAYMSPEQCAGMGDVDGRSDIYSLAVMLYEMIAGEPPFQGSFRELLSLHILQEPLPLGERVPGLASEVAQFIHRMMAKEPSRRPGIGLVIEELRRWEGEALPMGAMSPPPGDEEPVETTSTVRSTRGRATSAATLVTLSEPFASPRRQAIAATEPVAPITAARQGHGLATTESRPEPVAPPKAQPEAEPSYHGIGQTTVTIPPRPALDENALLNLFAPPLSAPLPCAPPLDAPPPCAPTLFAPPLDAPPPCAPTLFAPPLDAPPLDAPPLDAPPLDAPPLDAPLLDAPPLDAPLLDAPPLDAPPLDAPPLDAPPMDAPLLDAPPLDAPPLDAPPLDAPPLDAPPLDAPLLDAPPLDAPLLDAPPADALNGDCPASEPRAPSAPAKEEVLLRSRRRRLVRIGVIALVAALIAVLVAPNYRYFQELFRKKLGPYEKKPVVQVTWDAASRDGQWQGNVP